MSRIKSMLNRIREDRRGVTLIEYALAASLIAVASIAAMQTVGNQVSTVMNEVAGALK